MRLTSEQYQAAARAGDGRAGVTHIERAMIAAASIQREADAAGTGRISAADRLAGNEVGQLLTEFVWNGMPPHYRRDPRGVLIEPLEREPDWPTGAEIALKVATQVRATGSGFGLALAEWLEGWAGEEQDA